MEPPQLEARDMKVLSLFLFQLEQETLSATIIRETKIHKVLKYIIRRGVIPNEHKLHIKERAASLLEKMKAIMHEEEEAFALTSTGSKEPDTTEESQSQPSTPTEDHNHRPEDKVERPTTPSHDIEKAIQPVVIDLTEDRDLELSSRVNQVQDLQEDKTTQPPSKFPTRWFEPI